VRGHSQNELQQDRQTASYQRAMTQASSILAQVSPERALPACDEYLAEN
jgi:hypothetical protein